MVLPNYHLRVAPGPRCEPLFCPHLASFIRMPCNGSFQVGSPNWKLRKVKDSKSGLEVRARRLRSCTEPSGEAVAGPLGCGAPDS